jgi:hypothetical protein
MSLASGTTKGVTAADETGPSGTAAILPGNLLSMIVKNINVKETTQTMMLFGPCSQTFKAFPRFPGNHKTSIATLLFNPLLMKDDYAFTPQKAGKKIHLFAKGAKRPGKVFVFTRNIEGKGNQSSMGKGFASCSGSCTGAKPGKKRILSPFPIIPEIKNLLQGNFGTLFKGAFAHIPPP